MLRETTIAGRDTLRPHTFGGICFVRHCTDVVDATPALAVAGVGRDAFQAEPTTRYQSLYAVSDQMQTHRKEVAS